MKLMRESADAKLPTTDVFIFARAFKGNAATK